MLARPRVTVSHWSSANGDDQRVVTMPSMASDAAYALDWTPDAAATTPESKVRSVSTSLHAPGSPGLATGAAGGRCGGGGTGSPGMPGGGGRLGGGGLLGGVGGGLLGGSEGGGWPAKIPMMPMIDF